MLALNCSIKEMKTAISIKPHVTSLLIATCLWTTSQTVFSAEPPEQDRAAILAMAGPYKVYFNFEETVPLIKDYELKKPYSEDANEIVYLVSDSGDRIELQHILTVGNGKRIVKHWRQIWTWQDTRLTEFQGNQKWVNRELSPEEVKGTWSQLVTQVDDSPRYESYGRWEHDGGYSRWQSQPTNRPLPRREHTKRSDYQILLGVNRHALTPMGWVHEQDNLKQVLTGEGKVSHYIARESGLNEYETQKDHDFSAADAYWNATKDFWKQVAAYWEKLESETTEFEIIKEIDEVSVTKALFELADSIHKDGAETPDAETIAKLIAPYVKS